MNSYNINLVDTNFNIINIPYFNHEKIVFLDKDDFFIHINKENPDTLWIYKIIKKVFIQNDETNKDEFYLVLKPFEGKLEDIINELNYE